MTNKGQNENQPEGFLRKIRNPDYRRKFVYSLVMFMAYAFLGMRVSQHSSAFLDLAQITGTNIEQASAFYTAIAVGSLLGSICMGFLYDKVVNQSHLLLGSSCILTSVTTAAIPWCVNYPLMVSVFLVGSLFNGGFDIGGNTDFMRIWGGEGNMFVQFLHFCFSFGAIVSPFTVEPFLSEMINANGTRCRYENTLQHYNFQPVNVSMDNSSVEGTRTCRLTESRIHYSYIISAALTFSSGVAIIIEGCLNKKNKTQQEDNSRDNFERFPIWRKTILLGLVGIFYFFHLGTCNLLIGYIMPFVVNRLGWSKDDGTKLTSAFFALLAVVRFIGVFVAKILSPSKMLLLSNITSILSICLLWISAVINITWGIWLSFIMFSIGLGSIFPTGIIYMESQITRVTGKTGSVIWIGGYFQGIVNPFLAGYLIQEVSVMWYVYLVFIEAALCLVSYCLLELLTKCFVTKYRRGQTIEVEADDSKDNFLSE